MGILQENARMDVSRIAVQVYKSPSSTAERIKRLVERGYIRRFIAVLDRRLVGRPILMITLVKLNQHAAQTLNEFSSQMYQNPEVQICLHLSGEYDFMLQVSLKDPSEYQEFLDTKLCNLAMVEKIQSSLVLKECKMEAALPLLS